MESPYLTLGMMLGDAHVGVLARCLRSVLERSSGKPLVDEIVLGWNGSDEEGLRLALLAVGYTKDHEPNRWVAPSKPLLITVPFKWPGRFDVARNEYWKHCRGEWLLWLDADDEVADAGTPKGLAAIERVEKDYGIPPIAPGEPSGPPTTLADWLRGLPPRTNVVFAPYNYTEDEFGYVLVRQKMKRIVRRSAGHVWHSPEQSGIHEILTTIGGVPEVMAETFGFLVQHHPSQDEVVRTTRNREIVEALTKPGISSDPRHAYDVANAALSAGNLQTANEALTQAIIHAHNDMDRYTYRLARAYLGCQEGHYEKMLQEAFAAVGLIPELRDAYFIACEAFYYMAKWGSVVEWYERGICKAPTLMSRDQPLAMYTAPRAQAALAYATLGRPDKAMELVLEMEREYPKAGLTLEVGKKIRAIAARQEGEIVLFKSLEFLLSVSPSVAAATLRAFNLTHALDILRSTLPWAALTRKIQDASGNRALAVEVVGDVARFNDNGLIGVDDVLEHLSDSHQVLFAGELPEQRSMKVITRARATKAPRKIAFYAPVGIARWMPSEFDAQGMGGSESSVALLARELTELGHHVTVFTNKPTYASTSLWNGVVLKDTTQFIPSAWGDDTTVIYCRAPWAIREDPPATKNVYCWHQDNGYGNAWMSNRETAKLCKHLFVSEFARRSVLKDAGFAPNDPDAPTSYILGNGIDPACATGWSEKRRPHSVVYASNPVRGLEALLNAWPLVLAKVPDAHLTVMCEWKVMLATHQDEPGFTVPQKLQMLQGKLVNSPSTTNLDWQPQAKVLEVFKNSEVYAYPGYAMAEGFGVALVQAQACGCVVVAPSEGALEEVLDDDETFWLGSRDAETVATRILDAFEYAEKLPQARTKLARHFWPNVAARFLHFTGGGK